MYDKASIALIPSGVNDGTLYSVLPANGNGDFTHSRSLTTATRVNKDGLIESVAADVPRLDYPLTNGVVGNCPHLLLEPSRTNSIPYSVFDGDSPTGWAVGFGTGTFTHELTTFRGQSAIKHTQLTTGRSYLNDSLTLATSTTYTFSMYVDLENSGDIVSNEVIAAVSITGDFGDDEVTFGEIDQNTGLVKFTFTTGTSTSCNLRIGLGAFGDTNQLNKPLIFSMPQLEVGSYPTSYIPTSGNAATRSADVCNSSGTSAEFNDSEGVLFAEISSLANDGTIRRIAIPNTGFTALHRLEYYSTSNVIIAVTYVSPSNQVVLSHTLSDSTEFIKIAYKYKSGDFALWVNGVEVGTSVSGNLPTGLTKLNFDNGSGSNDFYGKVKQLIYFNEALSDSELQTLTS